MFSYLGSLNRHFRNCCEKKNAPFFFGTRKSWAQWTEKQFFYSIPQPDSLPGGAHIFLRVSTRTTSTSTLLSSLLSIYTHAPAINEGCISYYFSRVEKRLHMMIFFALFPAENEHADFHSHESVCRLARSSDGSIQQKAAHWESRTENDKVRAWCCTRPGALNENACKWAPCSLIKK
jgi:hypothetical protein